MLTAIGFLILILGFCLGAPLVWVIAHYSPSQHKKLIALEDQRRAIEREIIYEASNSDWLTKWRFKRYLKKGG